MVALLLLAPPEDAFKLDPGIATRAYPLVPMVGSVPLEAPVGVVELSPTYNAAGIVKEVLPNK